MYIPTPGIGLSLDDHYRMTTEKFYLKALYLEDIHL